MPSKALSVAIASGLLLIAVVGADAAMNRTYEVHAFLDGRWILVVTPPQEAFDHATVSLVPFPLNASDEVRFRIQAHNGYPWTLAKDFELVVGGTVVQRGALQAAAFQDDTEELVVPASALMTHGAGYPVDRMPPTEERFWSPQVALRVGGETFHGGMGIREVPR